MIHIVTYDISETAIRNRIIDACRNRGLVRVQRSVFMGDLAPRKKEQLETVLAGIMSSADQSTDSILIVPVCERCIGERRVLGHPLDATLFDETPVRFL